MNVPNATVADYLSELSPDVREALERVRQVILAALPAGFEETMQSGMISYCVPLARYPRTYNGKPLVYAALAAQKRHNALYLMRLYSEPDAAEPFEQRAREAGYSLDRGKSCLRFRKAEDLPLDLVAEVIAATDVEDYIALYERARLRR